MTYGRLLTLKEPADIAHRSERPQWPSEGQYRLPLEAPEWQDLFHWLLVQELTKERPAKTAPQVVSMAVLLRKVADLEAKVDGLYRLLLSPTDAEIQERFRTLADQWREDTQFLSADDDIAMHPAYQQIIGMGPRVVPLILHELKESLDHWFWALESITQESPVDPEDAGNMERMRDVWIAWSRSKGLIV